MYTNRPLQITLIDDDPQMREMLNDFFTGKYAHSHVKTFATGEEALSTMMIEPNLIVLDYHLDSSDAMAMNGLQVLKKLKEKYPLVPEEIKKSRLTEIIDAKAKSSTGNNEKDLGKTFKVLIERVSKKSEKTPAPIEVM